MTHPDRLRRAATALAVTGALVLVPAAAIGKFTDVQQPTLSVSTDRMETPTGVTGGYWCSSPGSNEAITISVTGFTDAGPAGSSYTYRLSAAGATTVTQSSTSHSHTISGSRADDNRSTTWTLSIQSVHGSWTGTAWSTAVVCNRKSSSSGNL
jgi:hypothetical protein